MKLFHSTTRANAESIKEGGFINSPVNFFPSLEAAEDFGSNITHDFVVIQVDLGKERLEYGSDLVSDHRDVSVENAGFTYYNDCEAIEV